ncbi:hypothetical protein FOL47_006806 [Perkinsus chesapeaki]|uniref:Uncharacterized protein n=1 Tax=Perkinsus chesapeaki TaxID=330153 RepID=A0A7J6MX36_PERCH|nr:hypothetical protein FOL47_006806 [Perkinsus chesapeaki]
MASFPVFEEAHRDGESMEAHWLPALAQGGATGGGHVSKCCIKDYFLIEDEQGYDGKTSNKLSAFRGRQLRGKEIDCGEMTGQVLVKALDEAKTTDLFDCVKYVAEGPSIHKITVWNHDEIPLRSDEAPQAFALSRAMDSFGRLAGETTAAEVDQEISA